ncbi:MAG: cotH [Planctomycetaceae bacterium]|nr:cotH [Planctomycetaceae bacterium]
MSYSSRCNVFVAMLFLSGATAMLLEAQENKTQGGKPRPNQKNQGPQSGPPGGGGQGGGPGGQGVPGGPGPGGPGGRFGGHPGGPGGPGGPMSPELELVKEFDKDADGRLSTQERKAAREAAKSQRAGRGPGGPPGGPGGRGPGGQSQGTPRAGKKISPSDVKADTESPFYDTKVLRTFFLEFESEDWESELADFYHTDVEVPATLTVDGKKYPNVGVHFRGASSFFTVSAGFKRSLNLSLDFVDPEQRLYGYKTINLLNSHDDPTFMHTVLYSHIAQKYLPVPKANFAKVAINGENWGIYTNAQQFDKIFLKEHYSSTKGTRWKIKGSPRGGGGLDYIGDDVEAYKQRYQIKSEDNAEAWKALIALCKTLSETPPDQLEDALASTFDIDSALWFLALENALINSDGYWIRASDYSLYLDEQGKFHVIPHDMNEVFQPAMGPGMGGPRPGGPGGPGGFGPGGPPPGGPGQFGPGQNGNGQNGPRPGTGNPGGQGNQQPGNGPRGNGPGNPGQNGGGPGNFGPGGNGGPPGGGPGGFGGPGGPGGPGPMGGGPRPMGGGIDLDPLIGMEDGTKPLRSKLLAVPALKTRYLDHVRTIATDWLDWKQLEPVVDQYVTLIGKELEADTRKLTTYPLFKKAVGKGTEPVQTGHRPIMTLGAFAQQRRKFLLNYPEIKKAIKADGKSKTKEPVTVRSPTT